MPARLLTARALRRMVYLLAVVVVLLSAVQSYQDLRAARRRSAELERRIDSVKQEIVRLERATEAMRNDPETMERVARQQLGLVREGEVILMLPKANGKSLAPAEPTPQS